MGEIQIRKLQISLQVKGIRAKKALLKTKLTFLSRYLTSVSVSYLRQ